MADRVTFKYGSASDYSSVTKDPNTFYYTIDNNKFYMGSNFLASGGDIPYTTELPTSDNTSGHLIAVVTDTIPVTRYDGYMYIVINNSTTPVELYNFAYGNVAGLGKTGTSLPLDYGVTAQDVWNVRGGVNYQHTNPAGAYSVVATFTATYAYNSPNSPAASSDVSGVTSNLLYSLSEDGHTLIVMGTVVIPSDFTSLQISCGVAFNRVGGTVSLTNFELIEL